jgi:hypothetical protein
MRVISAEPLNMVDALLKAFLRRRSVIVLGANVYERCVKQLIGVGPSSATARWAMGRRAIPAARDKTSTSPKMPPYFLLEKEYIIK